MKPSKILGYASTAAAALAAIPVPGVQVAGAIAAGLLALGAQIADEDDPVPHVARVRDQWPQIKAALATADAAKARAKASPVTPR